MTAKELREKFLAFMESKGHTIIPSASLEWWFPGVSAMRFCKSVPACGRGAASCLFASAGVPRAFAASFSQSRRYFRLA